MATNPLVPPMDPRAMAAMGMPNPFAPPPPPSPSLGFQVWASDPQNAHKVVPAMTGPNQPLQPNAGQPQMASANPPQPAPMASAAPPQQTQLGADQAELQRLQKNGAGVNQIHNGFLRGLAKAGDIVAPFILGGGAEAIPGTTVHNRMLQRDQQGRIANDQAALQADMTQREGQANLAHTRAETAAIPINAGMKRQQYLAALAKNGQVEDASGAIVDDPNSIAYQQKMQKDETLKSQADYMTAGIELRQAQAALAASKNDPNSAAYKQAQQRLVIAQQNAGAAQQRAQAYMGRYMQSAYNVGLNGAELPGATQIADDNGNETTVGTGNAPQAVKNQANVAQFNDIDGATNNIEKAATNLVQKGGKLNDAAVAAAIADPNTTSGQWAQGKFVNSGLSPEQRDYVVQVKSYKENLQSLRKSAGGSVSDTQVDRLMSMAPGASTPDLDYLKRQTGQIRQMRARLSAGVSTSAGGVQVKGRGNPMQPPTQGAPKGVQVLTDGGTTYHIPTAQVAEFKKDHPNAR